MVKRKLSMDQAEKNRAAALAYYHEHMEECREKSRERYRRMKKSLNDDMDRKMEYAVTMSDRTALYYVHRKMKKLSEHADLMGDDFQDLLRKACLRYAFDPETMKRHIEVMLQRRHRVPAEDTRRMAMIINEAMREYKINYNHKQINNNY